MKTTIKLFAISLFFYACSSGTFGREQTIELTYIAWGCDCANWATAEDMKKYGDDMDSLGEHCVYIETAPHCPDLPDTLGFHNDIIRFTGKFLDENGFPNGFPEGENPEPAKVFRYTSYQIIKSNHYESQKNDSITYTAD